MTLNPSRYSAAHQMVAALHEQVQSRREWLLALDDLTTAELELPEHALLLVRREMPEERVSLYGRALYDRSWLVMCRRAPATMKPAEFACSPYSAAAYILAWLWHEKSNNPELEVMLVNCRRCNATGLVDAGRRMGGNSGTSAGKVGVLCPDCRGTGCTVSSTSVFRGRHPRRRRYNGGVFAANPGGLVAGDTAGGVGEDTWESNPDSVYDWGREARQVSCPAWWRDCVNGPVKIDWPECAPSYAGSFVTCPKFSEKVECWKKFDEQVDAMAQRDPTAP